MNRHKLTVAGAIKTKRAIGELSKLVGILGADYKSFGVKASKSNRQFLRRAAVHAAFAFIEGVSNGMKQVALVTMDQLGGKFSQAERAVLLGRTYSLQPNGKAKPQEMKTPTPANVKFAFSVLNRAYLTRYKLNTSGKGWVAFAKGLRIRDRLAHPKKGASLRVTKREMQTLDDAVLWFNKSSIELLNRTTRKTKALVKRISRTTTSTNPGVS